MPDTGPLILAFDTSAAHCAAALLSGDEVLQSAIEPMAKGQAERLLVLCQEIMAKADVAFTDLDAIGVGIGPGNFTGIRISVAAARGLALGLNIPAIGVSTLEAQAYGRKRVVVSTLDARRDMLYLQVLNAGEALGPYICTMDDLPPIPARAEPTCIGFRNEEIAGAVSGYAEDPAMPLADAIAHIAASRRLGNRPRPSPLYLRAPDAAPGRDTPPVILP